MLGRIGLVEPPQVQRPVLVSGDRGTRDTILPRNKVSFRIDTGAKAMNASGPIPIMSEVVFTASKHAGQFFEYDARSGGPGKRRKRRIAARSFLP